MISDIGSSWSPGTYVFVPVIIVLLALLAIAVYWAFNNDGDWMGMPWAAVGVMVVTIGLSILAYWPLSADFHKYYPVTGTVQTVDSRLIGNGDSGVSQRFVVVLKESGQPFAIDDTRATLLKPGDSVNLRCKREFEWNSVPGWGCKWNTAY